MNCRWCFVLFVLLISLALVPNVEAQSWQPMWQVSGTNGNWQDDWIKDGTNGRAQYTNDGLEFDTTSGEGDEYSSILWSKPKFEGSVKFEYEFKRVDTNTDSGVSIVLLYGHGTGGVYPDDISTWNRPVSDRDFHRTMNNITISYATNDKQVRTRINTGRNLVEPVYKNVPYFQPGVWHKIMVTQEGLNLSMEVENLATNQKDTYSWNLPRTYDHGRVGLRQMYMHKNVYRNIKVSGLNAKSSEPTSTIVPTNTLVNTSTNSCDITVSNTGQLKNANSQVGQNRKYIVCLNAGTYDPLSINPGRSGTAQNPIVYKRFPGSSQSDVIFKGSQTLLNISKNYIVVDGFSFIIPSGMNGSEPAISISGSHNTVKNSLIERTGPNLGYADPRVALLHRDGWRDFGVSFGGNHNTLDNNTIKYFSFGIKVKALEGEKNKIINNTVKDTAQSNVVIGSSRG